jgi:hypothetical protein
MAKASPGHNPNVRLTSKTHERDIRHLARPPAVQAGGDAGSPTRSRDEFGGGTGREGQSKGAREVVRLFLFYRILARGLAEGQEKYPMIFRRPKGPLNWAGPE